MADFQNVSMQNAGVILIEHLELALLFGIPRKEKAALAKFHTKNERIIVFWGRCYFFGRNFRPQERAGNAVPGKSLASGLVLDGDAALPRNSLEACQRWRSHFAAEPKLANMKILQNCCQAAEMILMRVRQRDNIQSLKAAGPQVRRHRLFARIRSKVFFVARKSLDRSASIDQHCSTVRPNHKKRIALTDIENRQLQLPLGALRLEGKYRYDNAASNR